ncbi:ABC transporter [Aspergillus sp. HF37]|nr:ABC transporter [Aspergillus sp. HF37]
MARSMQIVGIAIIMALFFAPLQNDYAAVQSQMGFIQEFAALHFVGVLQNIAIYPNERDVFYCEEADNCYSAESFMVQYTTLEIPFEIVSSLIFGILAASSPTAPAPSSPPVIRSQEFLDRARDLRARVSRGLEILHHFLTRTPTTAYVVGTYVVVG